jgi:hypothetical protein
VTAALQDGVVGGGFMDGIGMGSSEMRMVAVARTTESRGWCGASVLVGSGGADSGGGDAGRRRWW